MPFDSLPEPFRLDWEAFKDWFGKNDHKGRRFSAAAFENMRTAVTYGANAAIAAGLPPITLAEVITPAILKGILFISARSARTECARPKNTIILNLPKPKA